MRFFDAFLVFFVFVGSKLLMGVVAIYMLLPRDARCEICDAEMLPVEHPRGSGRLLRLLRLQRRWCMECGTACLGRRLPSRRVPLRQRLPVAQPGLR